MSPARFRWGLFLVLLGTLWFLRNLDVLNDNFWVDLLFYLPVVLIAVGVEKIFSKSKLQFISYLTSVFLFVGAVYIAVSGSSADIAGNFFSRSDYSQDGDPSITVLHAVIDLDETDLTIRDAGDELIYGRFNRFTRKPKIEYTRQGNEATVTLTSHPQTWLGGVIKIETNDSQDWYLRFSKDVPLEVTCRGSNSDLHLNFSTTPLRNLELNADKATVYLKLGDLEPLVKVAIIGKDSDVRLRVPRDVGLKVTGEEYRSYLSRLGLREENNGFVSEGFDTLQSRIEVDVDSQLSSFAIDFF
jgi:hypothetical protein